MHKWLHQRLTVKLHVTILGYLLKRFERKKKSLHGRKDCTWKTYSHSNFNALISQKKTFLPEEVVGFVTFLSQHAEFD